MKIKKFIKQLYIRPFCSIYSKQYAYMLKVNNIPNAASPGEEKGGGVLEDLGSKSIEGNLQGVLSIYGRWFENFT